MFLFLGLGAYFLLMLIIGWVTSKKVNTVEDYLVAKRRLPFYIAMPTIVATWFGAGSCLGVSGMVYSGSFYEVIADPFAISCALLLAGVFFAAAFRKTGKFTIADILASTYGKKTERTASLLMLPFYIGTLASQMLALGVIFHLVTGFDTHWGIVIASFVVIAYTMGGGMWAVSCTDVVQLILLAAGLCTLFVITWQAAPLEETLPQFWREFSTLRPHRFELFALLAFAGQILLTGLGAIMGQDLIQRFFACKTPAVAKWSTLASGGVYFLLALIPLFIGVAGRSLYPDLAVPEQLMPKLAQDHLPALLFTLFSVGLIAAIMSTADSYLLAGTAILTQNLFKTDNLKMIRLSNILVAALAFIVALYSKSIFNLMVHSGTTLFVSIFVPTTMALFWKGGSRYPQAALFAMFSGLAGWLGWLFFIQAPDLTFEERLFAAAAVGGAASLVGYFIPVVFKISVFARQKIPH